MSAHASKGKQADYVIILDVIDDKFGFPSKVDTDPILETLMPGLDGFKHAEERRLFYVALSRAKQSVYVLTERGKESEFIAELKGYTGEVIVHLNSLEKDFYEEIRCPECLEGKLLPKDGKFGIYYACSLGKVYCDTRLKPCELCSSSPMIPNETHFECASSKCDNKLEICPNCNVGILKERKNSKDGSMFLSCNHYSKKDDKYCGYTRSLTSKWQVKSEQVR